jgi:hypothetical protein
VELFGVYSTAALAEDAAGRAGSALAAVMEIVEVDLDETYWLDGFVNLGMEDTE